MEKIKCSEGQIAAKHLADFFSLQYRLQLLSVVIKHNKGMITVKRGLRCFMSGFPLVLIKFNDYILTQIADKRCAKVSACRVQFYH